MFPETVLDVMCKTFPQIDTEEKRIIMYQLVGPLIDQMFLNDKFCNIKPDTSAYLCFFKEFIQLVYTERITFDLLCSRIKNWIDEILKNDEINRDRIFYCCPECVLFRSAWGADCRSIKKSISIPITLLEMRYMRRDRLNSVPLSSEMETMKTFNEDNFLKKHDKQIKDKIRYHRNKGIIPGNRSKRIKNYGKNSKIKYDFNEN
jgi:hypothetical protein